MSADLFLKEWPNLMQEERQRYRAYEVLGNKIPESLRVVRATKPTRFPLNFSINRGVQEHTRSVEYQYCQQDADTDQVFTVHSPYFTHGVRKIPAKCAP